MLKEVGRVQKKLSSKVQYTIASSKLLTRKNWTYALKPMILFLGKDKSLSISLSTATSSAPTGSISLCTITMERLSTSNAKGMQPTFGGLNGNYLNRFIATYLTHASPLFNRENFDHQRRERKKYENCVSR